MKIERTKQIIHGLLLFAGVAFLGSCSTLKVLSEDVRAMNQDTRIIGNVAAARAAHVKILVLKKGAEGFSVADTASPNRMGDFVFLLPAKKSYYVAAIDDRASEGSSRRADPLVSFYGGRTPKEVASGQASDAERIVLDFGRNADRARAFGLDLKRALANWRASVAGESGSVRIGCGEIASLDDPMFDPEAGEKGLWAPVTAAKRNGLGVYFMEAYDPEKIPVVFVHGIGGTPRSWQPIIRSLDRRRYQAWFYSYPSGLPLESVAKGLADLSTRLQQHYGFTKMHLVAHSMGGLVARRAVQMISNEGKQNYVSSLTTFSTPWNGVPFAIVGTLGLASPVPSWHDLRPNSRFIRKILDDPLPMPHLLVATEKTRFKLTVRGPNDGSVSLSSQMDPRAVSKAEAHLLVTEDHTRVLEVDETKQALTEFLKTVR